MCMTVCASPARRSKSSRLRRGGKTPKRTSISHSSCVHPSSRHQSPEVRHGPDAAKTSPRIPLNETHASRPSRISTLAGKEGLKTRNEAAFVSAMRSVMLRSTNASISPAAALAAPHLFSIRAGHSVKLSIAVRGADKASHPKLIRTVRVRQLRRAHIRSPTRFASRAIVSSSFSGSGEMGRNKPPCAKRGFAGSAAINTFQTAVCGGSDCKSQSKQFQQHLRISRRHRQRQTFLVRGRRAFRGELSFSERTLFSDTGSSSNRTRIAEAASALASSRAHN